MIWIVFSYETSNSKYAGGICTIPVYNYFSMQILTVAYFNIILSYDF